MATRTEYRSTSAAAEREHHRGSPWHQLARFFGLYLSPLLGLVGAWLLHLWIGGVHLHSARGEIDLGGHALWWMAGTVAAILGATGLLAWDAWEFAEHRKPALRITLLVSVILIGVMFALNVITGPSWRPAGMFLIAGVLVATAWMLARLDVTRNDKRGDEDKGDDFLEKHDLKGWRATSEKVIDEKGRWLATKLKFKHAPGDQVDRLSDAIGAFESVSASPAGLSHVTPGDRADRSELTLQHLDPLVEPTEVPEPVYPGGSIVDPLLAGKYQNGEWVKAYLAGGNGFSPSSFLLMGMNRTGKTQEESILISDAITRRDVVFLYLNKAKGLQDVRPVIPGIEAAVIDDSPNGALYREAINQLKRIISYRQRQLALFAIHEWNAEQCWNSPPWRDDEQTGERVQMERMPFLIAFFGEADAILMDAGHEATYIVSKGLSTGVCTGWSLQRADATKMPTGLRFNLGTAWCFGCGDSDSVDMALSNWVVKAGAHPDRWGQRMPGYFYFEGLGIDEKLFVKPARSFAHGPGGTLLREELLRRNLQWAPRMAKLDKGSVNATRGSDRDGKPDAESWWERTAKSTDELRSQLLRGAATAEPANPTATVTDEDEEEWEEMQEEIRNMTDVEGVELYPRDPQTGERATYEDATAPLPPRIAPEDELTWDDPKPAPRDRPAALRAFAKALDELINDESLRDPADPSGNTVIVNAGLIADRYEFRSRPFFSAALNAAAEGRLDRDECPTELILSAAPDLGLMEGKYRLQRPTAGYAG